MTFKKRLFISIVSLRSVNVFPICDAQKKLNIVGTILVLLGIAEGDGVGRYVFYAKTVFG
jgi:hypothetical protein